MDTPLTDSAHRHAGSRIDYLRDPLFLAMANVQSGSSSTFSNGVGLNWHLGNLRKGRYNQQQSHPSNDLAESGIPEIFEREIQRQVLKISGHF